ncbi:MAG: zinc ribbon domain-containing protein [Chloroflexi bacterium]|nr:zinc ribbon domain-containing protein [Chloroflexota bacterium]
MPIYEYECGECGEKFELMRSFSSDDSELKCQKCGADNPRRTISLFASGNSSTESFTPSPTGGG